VRGDGQESDFDVIEVNNELGYLLVRRCEIIRDGRMLGVGLTVVVKHGNMILTENGRVEKKIA
jgi:hypothetical protein